MKRIKMFGTIFKTQSSWRSFKAASIRLPKRWVAALRRTSISPNIKERRDYSCALFDGREQVIAMGDHMPVHLGAMPMSVKAVVGFDGAGRGRCCDF